MAALDFRGQVYDTDKFIWLQACQAWRGYLGKGRFVCLSDVASVLEFM